MSAAPSIVVIAGEASGDAHAGRLIAALKQQAPAVRVSGIGGENMRRAGAELFADFAELAVMGLVEVLARYRHIRRIFSQLVARLETERPDLLVLVDYPGFNLKLAKKAKKLGIPVLYYISPKIWAWRPGRIKTIRRYVDQMAVLFPFEQPLYEQAGVPVRCVGHPLVDAVSSPLTVEQAKSRLGFDPGHRVLGLFPGSRRNEVQALLPIMIATAERIHHRHFDLEVVLPLAPGLDLEFVNAVLGETSLPVRIVTDDFYDVIRGCDAIVAASGTVTLEIALMAVPHLIVYRVSPLSYHILRRLVRIPHVGLCNIVTGRPLVTELLQDEVNVERLDAELTSLLTQPQARAKAESIGREVRDALGPPGGADNAARLVLEMLEQRP